MAGDVGDSPPGGDRLVGSQRKSSDKARPATGSGPARTAAKPETLEGVLVRQLIDDEISKLQYRRAMQRLPETDADRHPLTVPPDN